MNTILQPILSTKYPYTLVFFLPKSNTPGCTLESRDFSRLFDDFLALDTEVVGVSRDSETVQANFCEKHNLRMRMYSDSDSALHTHFGVIKEKTLFGKTALGVIRSTFLLDSETGEIIQEWRNIKANSHAETVLAYLEEHFEK